MAFNIIRNDITKVRCEAIVNTANPFPVIGRGTDSRIYEAAGREELLEERRKTGEIKPGSSIWTESYRLKKNGIKYIIHTAGIPYDDGKNGAADILRSCWRTSLNLASELGCRSVAVPLLGTGCYSFPKELGLQTAVDEISKFLLENDGMDVTLVVYDEQSYLISEKLFSDVQDFLDENFTGKNRKGHSVPGKNLCDSVITGREFQDDACYGAFPKLLKESEVSQKCRTDIEDFLSGTEKKLNFQNTLMQMIADRKLSSAEVYTKAFIDRKFFSKIISVKDYVPKKTAVMQLGLSLELGLKDFEAFLESAGYAFMPSSRFDVIVKYCVINKIYNIIKVDMILDSHGEKCFAPE